MKNCCFRRATDVEQAAEGVELHYGPGTAIYLVVPEWSRRPKAMHKVSMLHTGILYIWFYWTEFSSRRYVIQLRKRIVRQLRLRGTQDIQNRRLPELTINRYAFLMSYLSLAVRGLGYLVITWTTVVLLGGFVSMLNQKDFWSLTVIMLIETIGILDVSAKERISNIWHPYYGLLDLMSLKMSKKAGVFAALIQALVFVLLLCPIGAVYIFGLPVSAGLSMWRLIQQDYVETLDTDPNKKNLRPALNVLYSLALFQGGIFFYKVINSFMAGAITDAVARIYGLEGKESQAVMGYFHEVMASMENDSSCARRGWSLAAYALGLMESTATTRKRYKSGMRLLNSLVSPTGRMEITCSTATGPGMQVPDDYSPHESNRSSQESKLTVQKMVKRTVLNWPSADNVIRSLLWTIDSDAPLQLKDTEEIRGYATTILETIADEIHLEQFPGALRRIETLLDDNDYGSSELKLKGLNILRALAADEDNWRAMRDKPRLLRKIMGTLKIEQHQSIRDNEDGHRTWAEVARPALLLLLQLMEPPEESCATATPRLCQVTKILAISSSTLKKITDCERCDGELKKAATKILQHLPRDGDEA